MNPFRLTTVVSLLHVAFLRGVRRRRMRNRFALALLAMAMAFGYQTANSQPLKPCSQLNEEMLREHAKNGYLLAGGSPLKGGGWMAGFIGHDSKADHIYMEAQTLSSESPPSRDCPTPWTLVDECVDPRPTSGPITYKHWRCTATAPVPK
jgi:hypothetical protein